MPGWRGEREEVSWLRHRIGPGLYTWFGGRITFQWFGYDIRLRRNYLCWHWHRGGFPLRTYTYVSDDATPPDAPHGNNGRWIFGKRNYWVGYR